MHFRSYFLILLLSVACYSDVPCNKWHTEYGYVCVCNATYCDTISTPEKQPAGQFHFYHTSDTNPGFNHETGYFRMQSYPPYGYVYEVNSSKTYQTINGFGGAFTDSFGYVYNSLSKPSQENLMKSFFSEDGIEYTVCRVVLGSCDFSLREYTYAPDFDPSLKSFNLTEDDHKYKIAQMQKALKVSKKPIKFIGSTWSSPTWMKTNNSTGAGYIDKKFLQTWANFYVKALDAFKKEGIDFWGLTTGNEPVTLMMVKSLPAVVMFPEEQRQWVNNNLAPAIKSANYSTKIILLDDMRSFTTWWMTVVMRDQRSEENVYGIGLHWYIDSIFSPKILDKFHEKYPNKEIVYTESSINIVFNAVYDRNGHLLSVDPKFARIGPHLGSWKRASYYAVNIIENLNHWVSTYMDWNLALDTDGGPNLTDFFCDASIIVNNATDEFYKQPIYYMLGHFSKFMQPNSTVMDVRSSSDNQNENSDKDVQNSELFEGDINSLPDQHNVPNPMPTPKPDMHVQHAGVINPDGSHAITFFNPKSSGVEIAVHDPQRGYAFLDLEPNSISTIVYN